MKKKFLVMLIMVLWIIASIFSIALCQAEPLTYQEYKQGKIRNIKKQIRQLNLTKEDLFGYETVKVDTVIYPQFIEQYHPCYECILMPMYWPGTLTPVIILDENFNFKLNK